MGSKIRLRKVTDYETSFNCAGGSAILREEVWVDEKGSVIRYNLAFLIPHLTRTDHGRILGYDNAHGTHERHFMGKVERAHYQDYPNTSERFYKEAEAIRRSYDSTDIG